jgi:hypothetical protein
MMRARGLQVDHTTVWRWVEPERTLEGLEAMHMMGKGRVKRLDGRGTAAQAKFAQSLFGVAA